MAIVASPPRAVLLHTARLVGVAIRWLWLALLLAPRLLLGVHLAAGLGRDAVCLGQSAVCLGQSVGGLGLEPDDDGVKRAEKIEAALGSDGAGAAGEAL